MKYTEILPKFIGIGAQRAGTTWLMQHFRGHPDIWVSPRKELHYFDRSPDYPSPSFLASDHLLPRLFGKEKHHAEWRILLKESIIRNYHHPNWSSIRWYFRFFFRRYNDEWYASLFKEGKDKVSGEITPSYSILESRDVEHIHRIMPKAKIIYFLRNPIDRAWSMIRHGANVRGQSATSLSLANLKKNLDMPHASLRGDYVRTINTWRTYFPEEQFFIGFFEDIERDAENCLLSVFRFLGVRVSREYINSTTATQKVNVAPQKGIPSELRFYLAEKYYDQIKMLSTMIGGYATHWLEAAKAILVTAE